MKAQRLSSSSDIITTLPQAIIEAILCLLSTDEAARTSILSKEWRYKWTTIPKLKFDRYAMFKRTNMSDLEQTSHMGPSCKLFCAIHQVLLLRLGPIHEFTLSMDAYETDFEIDQIILHLSRNHPVKKLTLDLRDTYSYKLPLSVFSLRHLTELNLDSCQLVHQPTFNGFASLTSLSLFRVSISRESLLHLLSNCPSLKILYLDIIECLLGDESPSIVELFKCLPMIEVLTTSGYFVQLLVQVSVPEELPTSLIHLKYCTIEYMCFVDDNGLPFLCDLIKCSPNLEKIKLQINTECCEGYSDELEEYSVKFEEYSDVWLEHLNEVEIEDFANFRPELEFVKFILARSPGLKKLILRTYGVDKNEVLEMLKRLSPLPVEIVVENSIKHFYDFN